MPVSPRDIPSIEVLLQSAEASSLHAAYGRDALVSALRDAAAALRDQLASDPVAVAATGLDAAGDVGAWIVRSARADLEATRRPSLIPVINASGVIVHTNLGRAPLGAAALARVAAVARGYANLEYDLARGTRGRRDTHAESLLRELTGAEAGVVVNNNAAATLLMLAALAAGREVLISRGELVEIGGGFRVPDVMRQSGAMLREVGTTNRTRVADYAAAIGDRTAAILRVHPSNFRMEGFTERPALAELAALGRRHAVAVLEDLGSGNVLGPSLGLTGAAAGEASAAVHEEPAIRDSIAAGVDVLCVSGDKLLGGPQAGIVLGRRQYLDRIRTHPLMRALRVDKLTYAALEGTLLEHLAGRAARTVPVVTMLTATPSQIGARAERLARALETHGLSCAVIDGQSTIGGGSAPGSTLPTRLLAVDAGALGAAALGARLRAARPPVIARIEDDRVLFDLRTVAPDEDDLIEAAVAAASVPATS